MAHFLLNCLNPNAILMLFVALVCFFGYGVPGYPARDDWGIIRIFWLFLGILAIVAWVKIVFGL